MKTHLWIGGLSIALWLGGCTEANPAYEPPDGGDVPSEGTGDVDVPPPDDAAELPSDVVDVPVDVPADVPVDVPADVPVDVPADVPPDVVLCGNGAVDPGEECDDDSAFCTDCALAPPAGWVECADASGNPVFFLLAAWPGNHTADAWRDRCRTTIEGLAPEGYEAYGLAAFYDQALWDCVAPTLSTDSAYWVGSRQDREASDYAEPDGGWYWSASDGSASVNLAPVDGDAAWLPATFDGTGGSVDDDCGRLQAAGGDWALMDYSCTSDARIEGICMVRY